MKKRMLGFIFICMMLITLSACNNVYQAPPMDPAKENKVRYELIEEKMSWSDAKEYCENEGGHLVTIESEEEKEEIRRMLGTDTDVWIGAQLDEDYNANWITNGTELNDSFFEYSSGESSEAASYIKMRGTDTDDKLIIWNDFDYNVADGFICEWED